MSCSKYFYTPRKLKCLSAWQKLSSGLCLDKDMTLTAVSFTVPDPEVSEALSSKGLTSLWKSSNNHDVSFGYYSLLSFSLCSCSLSGFTVSSQLDHLWELFSSLFFSCQPSYLATFSSLACKLPFLLFIDSASCVGSSALVTGSSKKGLLERNLVLGLVM